PVPAADRGRSAVILSNADRGRRARAHRCRSHIRKTCYTSPVILGLGVSPMRRREFIALLGSGIAAWPLAARAQQPARMKRLAIVHPILPPEMMNENSESPVYRSFFSELHRLGYIEGNNLLVERRSGEGRTERYSDVARELVALKPDVMVVTSARI